MSHAVSPQDLHATALPYGNTPFLLYVGSSGTARVNHVAVQLSEGSDQVIVTGIGRGVAKTLTPDLVLSLLWPPYDQDGFSLIADGTGTMDGEGDAARLILTISAAVLHRPAPKTEPA